MKMTASMTVIAIGELDDGKGGAVVTLHVHPHNVRHLATMLCKTVEVVVDIVPVKP